MKYQILKQYTPGIDTIYVGSIGSEDQLEIFDTLQQAEDRKNQLEILNPDRRFKIVEKE